MNTFICDCCEKEIELNSYSFKISDGETVYFDKNTRKPYLCDKGKNIKPKDNSFKGIPMINAYSSMSKQDKSKSLLKRSQDHFKKEVTEQKYEMNKKYVNDFKNGGE